MTQLETYLQNTYDANHNFYLGLEYETLNHYSPASSFYLRCAELTEDITLKYEALLRLYLCYSQLGNRNYTCENILKHALHTDGSRPEAYFFLTQLYESNNDWLNVYTYSTLGLNFGTNTSCVYRSNIPYPGIYGLWFQKAAAAWWYGKTEESRELFRYILDTYIDALAPAYRSLLETNLSRLGSGPESQAIRTYFKDKHRSLFKFMFTGLDLVDKNFSQVYQDLFVLTLLDGKTNGTYLEIGSSEPFKNNNTALLEQTFSWTGVGIEFQSELVAQYKQYRHNPVICTDALIVDYKKLLSQYFPTSKHIDYLQLDIEPPKNTYEVLVSLPMSDYTFGIITYEHDDYVDITKSYKQKSREYLYNLGYVLLVNDVSPDNKSSFEDWWIHPKFIEPHKIKLFEDLKNNTINPADKIFLK